jgi:hypothetical protein
MLPMKLVQKLPRYCGVSGLGNIDVFQTVHTSDLVVNCHEHSETSSCE